MAYIMCKNGLTLGQKESNFKTIGQNHWLGPIGLKAKDPYWGGMGI